MTRKAVGRIIVVTIIVALLGGASWIIAGADSTKAVDAPSGFFH